MFMTLSKFAHPRLRRGSPSLSFLLILSCLLLLNACGSVKTGTGEPLSMHKNAPHVQTRQINQVLLQEGESRLQTLQSWIKLMQQFNGDASDYQKAYLSSQKNLKVANTDQAYQAELALIEQQINAIKIPALRIEGSHLSQTLTRQATSWGSSHNYHDSYNSTTYPMAYEYGSNGVAGWIQDDMNSAKTISDYQQVIEETGMFLNSFQAYKSNVSDKTPWNKVHQTDMQLLKRYNALQGKVAVVSLSEQVMRLYNNGRLVKAFEVTTGRPEKPSPPGVWSIQSKQSPTVFKSTEPVGSPYWYPDTPIHYALLYHEGGYFIHDSWWRSDYGANTQFPHRDSGGDEFSFDGSHGCINVSTDNAAWIYSFLNVNSQVIIY